MDNSHKSYKYWSGHMSKIGGCFGAKLILIGATFCGTDQNQFWTLVLEVKIVTNLEPGRSRKLGAPTRITLDFVFGGSKS